MQGSPRTAGDSTPPGSRETRRKLGTMHCRRTHAQIWGTLKRYLAYTAAGFVVLGGVGAMEAARPPLVTTASASQTTLRSTVSPQALLATIASDAPSWTQRLHFELTSATTGHRRGHTGRRTDSYALLSGTRHRLGQGSARRPGSRRAGRRRGAGAREAGPGSCPPSHRWLPPCWRRPKPSCPPKHWLCPRPEEPLVGRDGRSARPRGPKRARSGSRSHRSRDETRRLPHRRRRHPHRLKSRAPRQTHWSRR